MQETTQPVNTDWFQRRLDEATRDRGIRLRITWAPSLRVTRVIPENEKRVLREFAKYPIARGEATKYVLGHYFQRLILGKMVNVGYQKIGGVVEGNVLPTDVAVPHFEHINHSIQIFVIEQRIEDTEARRIHAKKKELSLRDLGFDMYGEFPREGMWEWWGDISQHHSDCCALAEQNRLVCSGLYREPDESDLLIVQQMLADRDARGRKVDVEFAVAQREKDMRDAYEDHRRKQQEEWQRIGQQIDDAAIRAVQTNTVFLNPMLRFTGNAKSRDLKLIKP